MSQNYTWYYKTDELRYKKFVVDVEQVFRYKLNQCAPIHGKKWADALADQIRNNFTGKEIAHIIKELQKFPFLPKEDEV